MEARQDISKRENLCCHSQGFQVCLQSSFNVQVLNVAYLSHNLLVQAVALDIKPQLTIHREL